VEAPARQDLHGAESFLGLLRPLERSLEVYARRMLRDASQTEDVLQEAVMEAWRRFPEFAPGTNFRAWMFRFLTHKILNANRRAEAVVLDDVPVEVTADEIWDLPDAEDAFAQLTADPDQFVERLEPALARALGRLAAAERACLLLKSVGGFTYREIHEALGIPMGSVMGYLARARRRMRLFVGECAAERGWLRRREAADDAMSCRDADASPTSCRPPNQRGQPS
jgi:RNA polymerase sigma-70 factor, ECF subfamily